MKTSKPAVKHAKMAAAASSSDTPPSPTPAVKVSHQHPASGVSRTMPSWPVARGGGNPFLSPFLRQNPLSRLGGDGWLSPSQPGLLFGGGLSGLGSMVNEMENAMNELSRSVMGGELAPQELRSSGGRLGTDVVETPQAFQLCADIPGFAKDDVHIEVDDEERVVTISAERDNVTKEDKDTDEVLWHRVERSFGAFRRSMRLPEKGVMIDDISAKIDNGVLTVNIPKAEPDAAEPEEETKRKIEIETAT